MIHAQSDNPIEPKQVCILWHTAERSPADALVRALIKRGFSVTLASDKHTVFAAACKSDKTADRVVVVLDDRESLIDVDRVLDALERFGPGVICWEHCEGANPPMVPFVRTVVEHAVEQPELQAEPESTETVPGRNIASPKLRLINNEQSNNQSNTESGAKSGLHTPTVSLPNLPKNGTISSCDVLNADELDALLAGEMGEGRRGK